MDEDGRIVGWKDEFIDGRMVGWKDECKDGGMYTT